MSSVVGTLKSLYPEPDSTPISQKVSPEPNFIISNNEAISSKGHNLFSVMDAMLQFLCGTNEKSFLEIF